MLLPERLGDKTGPQERKYGSRYGQRPRPWALLVRHERLAPLMATASPSSEIASSPDTSADAPDASADAKVPLHIKLTFGFGVVAYGIKDNGFAVFLLFYYNQVIGLDALLVSLALAIALCIDAFIDPLIGQLSDHTRTRFGKRHPWLYASALPIAIMWLLLWNPPEMSDGLTFLYLVVIATLVRFSLSAYEVPSLAMIPELTPDYHERTVVLRYRFIFGWAAGLMMLAMAYGYFLQATPEYENGLLNPDGYPGFAFFGAVIMVIAVLVSAIGTHRRIVGAYHRQGVVHAPAEGLQEMLGAFSFRPFLLLMLAGVFAFTIQGLIFALTNYLFTHVWELTEDQFLIYPLILFCGVLLAFLVVTPISKRLEKTGGASLFTFISLVLGTAPYWLRYFELFPANGSPMMLPLLFTLVATSTGMGIAAMILTMSMMADVTDAYEESSGKRTEGLFSAGMFFMQKMVGGLGILLSGLIISGVGLPEGAKPGTVDPAIVSNLTLIFALLITCLGIAGGFAYRLIPISHADHLARLRAKARGQREAESG
ncbi:MAG: MFS transporter [Pseudomonadota bacterium]